MKTILAAVALTALIPAAAAQAQETRVEERVVVMAGPGGSMEIGEEGLTREAFTARHMAMFDRLDADHDGVVSRDEMAAMAQAHGAGGHGMRFHGVDGEEIQLDGDGEWTSEDGQRRIVIRRRGHGAEGAPMMIDGETIDVEGVEGGEHRIIIRRSGPGGDTVEMHGGPGEWSGEGGEQIIVVGPGASGESGEHHVMMFRHDSEGGLDADGDGRWTFEEMTAPIREHFNQLDANHDGFVDAAERGAAHGANEAQHVDEAAPVDAAQNAENRLRSTIAELQAGTPDYGGMTPELAEVIRAQSASMASGLRSLGALENLEHIGEATDGAHQFRATFASGQVLTWTISINAESKIQGLLVQ